MMVSGSNYPVITTFYYTLSYPFMLEYGRYVHTLLIGMRKLLDELPELYSKFSKKIGGFVVRTYFRKVQHSSLRTMK